MERGKLIVFEGLDRTGKSTQSQLLSQQLENCVLIRFPNRESITGKQINDYLLGKQKINDEAIHLLFSANRWECKYTEYFQIANNKFAELRLKWVAYSCAKGLDFDWCLNCDKGLPKPDLIFYIELGEEEIQKRKGFGQELYENQEFQKKVGKQYEKLKDQKWIVVDGGQSVEKINEFILSTVQKYQIQGQKIEKI